MDFVSLDTWTIIMQWGNLFILYLLVRKFLFKPVKKILKQREDEVNAMFTNAQTAEKEAAELKAEYTRRLEGAKSEAEDIVKGAVKKAKLQSEDILRDAHARADEIGERAKENIEAERRNAVNEVKNDISSMAVSIASKVIEKEMSEKDHEKMIEDIIERMG